MKGLLLLALLASIYSANAVFADEIKGVVLFQSSNCPVPGLVVEVDPSVNSSQFKVVTTTAQDGSFTARVAGGAYLLIFYQQDTKVYQSVVQVNGTLNESISLTTSGVSEAAPCTFPPGQEKAGNGKNAQHAATQGSNKLGDPIALGSLSSGELFALAQLGYVSTSMNNSLGRVYKLKGDNGGLSIAHSFPLPSWEIPSDLVSTVVGGKEVLFVAGTAMVGGSIVEYSEAGDQLSVWPSDRSLSGLGYDPRTATLYATSTDNSVYRASVDSPNMPVRFCGGVVGAKTIGPLIVDSSRNRLIVGETQDGKLYSLDLPKCKSSLLIDKLGKPQALLLSADSKQLLIADETRHKIYSLDLSDPKAVAVTFSASPAYKEPVGLALLSSGKIAVADESADALFILSSGGEIVDRFPGNK